MKISAKLLVSIVAAGLSALYVYYKIIDPFLLLEHDKEKYAEIQKLEFYHRYFKGENFVFIDVNKEFYIFTARTIDGSMTGRVWILLNDHCGKQDLCYIGDTKNINIECSYNNYLSRKYYIDKYVERFLLDNCKK